MLHIIKRDSKRHETAEKLLETAMEFWIACNDEGQYGAVQWLIGETGELIIYTRGEYKDRLMENIDKLGTEIYHFEEQIDRRREDNRKTNRGD